MHVLYFLSVLLQPPERLHIWPRPQLRFQFPALSEALREEKGERGQSGGRRGEEALQGGEKGRRQGAQEGAAQLTGPSGGGSAPRSVLLPWPSPPRLSWGSGGLSSRAPGHQARPPQAILRPAFCRTFLWVR